MVLLSDATARWAGGSKAASAVRYELAGGIRHTTRRVARGPIPVADRIVYTG